MTFSAISPEKDADGFHHKNTFTVCYLSRKGKELKSFKVSKEGTEAFKQILTRDDEVAVESTGNTGYFVREIKDRVGGVKIINPTQFKIISQSVKKTDKRDVKIIAKYLSKGLVPKENQKRDALIGETCIVNKLILISNDSNFREAVKNFGGVAISFKDFLSQKRSSETPRPQGGASKTILTALETFLPHDDT